MGDRGVDRRSSATRSHYRQPSIEKMSAPAHDNAGGYSPIVKNRSPQSRSPRNSRRYSDHLTPHQQEHMYSEVPHHAQDSIRPMPLPHERVNPILRVQHPSGSINEEPVSPTIDIYNPAPPAAGAADEVQPYRSPRMDRGHPIARNAQSNTSPRAFHKPTPFDNQMHGAGGGVDGGQYGGGQQQQQHHETSVTVLHQHVYPTTVEQEPPFVDIYATHPPQYLRKQYSHESSQQPPYPKGKTIS